MNYTIYADVLFVENTLVNLVVLCIASRILGVRFRFIKILLSASIAGIINVISYLILFRVNGFLQIMVYAVTTLGMTALLFHDNKKAGLCDIIISILLSEFLITGLLTILISRKTAFPGYIVTLLSGFLFIHIVIGNIKEERENQNYIHTITIYMDEKKTETTGFMDSGNLLKLPLSQKGVIIGDRQMMLKVMPEEFHDFTKNYLNTGNIDYEALLKIPSKWMIIPVNYGSIDHKSGTMPGIICSKVVLDNGEREFSDVPICFSRMTLNSGYHMLLPKDLCSQNN